MKEATAQWLSVILLALGLAVLSYIYVVIQDQGIEIEAAMSRQKVSRKIVATLRTAWRYQATPEVQLDMSVSTTKKDDESDAEHTARFKAAVDAAMVLYPPVT